MLLEASILSDTSFEDKPFKISYQLLEALCLTDVSNLKKFFFYILCLRDYCTL